MQNIPKATRNISVAIERPADVVYKYASDPANLHEWATGLARQPLKTVDNQWFSDSPMGRVSVTFVANNEFGVLDHTVTLPNGEVVLNPVRVIANGKDECEVLFTLRQRSMTNEEFKADAQHVVNALTALKHRLEAK